MRQITVPLSGSPYPILIGRGLIGGLGEYLSLHAPTSRAVVVADSGIPDAYADRLVASLQASRVQTRVHGFPAGEASKSLDELGRIYATCVASGMDRGSVVVTLGGGVAGDLGGFAAATFLRGIRFVQVPTTLLAQVDASVGGKTGIDLPEGKNLVGAFHQPSLVVIDLETLLSLSLREYRSGLAEVVKYGVLEGESLFEWLESVKQSLIDRDLAVLEEVVERCCAIKARVVAADEREGGLRAILNYGHTVGHAVEAAAGYGGLLHGEAVSIGMMAAGELARRRGWFSEVSQRRVESLLTALGLPVRLSQPMASTELRAIMGRDKKVRDGAVRFVLARDFGRIEVDAVEEPAILEVLDWIQPV